MCCCVCLEKFANLELIAGRLLTDIGSEAAHNTTSPSYINDLFLQPPHIRRTDISYWWPIYHCGQDQGSMYSNLIIISAVVIAVHSAPVDEFYSNSGPHVFPHRAVEINAEHEALLPRELLKSREFYDNPAVAAKLAKESWFTSKESQVIDREAEKIPRAQIYKLINSAGFLDN